jgi:tol-pal system protein YbgF
MLQLRNMAVLFVGLYLSGCVVTQQDLQMQRDILELKRRLSESERALKELQDDTSGGVRATLETLARNQADFQAELDGVRVDLQSMQGQFVDQQRANEEIRQESTLLRDELRLQLDAQDKRINKLEETGLQPEKSVTPEKAPERVPVETKGSTSESPSQLYDRALKTIREERDFAAGRELMLSFLQQYPKDDLAVNADYWVGETYYAEKNYEKAILQFEDVIQKYEDHPKVASAMLKQAMAFDATGDKQTAKLLLERVADRFPLSEEATKAKQELKGM